MTKIFVAKLDYGVSNDQLKSLFEAYGKVTKATVAMDRETGKPRGFAFIEMPNNEEAYEAIKELDGYRINGRNIAVKEAEDRSNNRSRPHHHQRNDYNSTNKFKSDDSRSSKTNETTTGPSTISPEEITSFKTNNRKRNSRDRERSESEKDGGGGKKTKMNAYKKSNKYKFDFDDDEEIEGGLFSFDDDEDLN